MATRRRWLQFSLRGLLALLTVFAIGLGWKVSRTRKQYEAVVALRRTLEVAYDFQLTDGYWKTAERKPRAPDWLIRLLGTDFFEDVIRVGVTAYNADAKGRHISQFNYLPRMITPDHLEHLSSFRRLRILDLHGVALTDADLKYIKPLRQLSELDIRDTKVTNVGIAALHKDLPNCTILH